MKRYKLSLCLLGAVVFFLMSSCVKETNYGSIQGIVSNAENNEPIQGVNISLSPTGLSTVTGSDGRYEFNNLDPGQYTVQAMKSGFQSNTKNITIVSGNISSGDMMLKPEKSGFKLNVEYLDFGTQFSQLSFKIINTSVSLPVNWSITESMNWLTATPSTGTLIAGGEIAVTVDIDRSKIQQSTTANITVSSDEQKIVLPVNVTVSGSSGPQLQLNVNSIDFGTSANQLPFYVQNNGPANTSLNWVCSPINVDWLTLNPTSGNTAGGSSTAVMASIDRSKIDGIVSTQVTVSGGGTSSSITFTASSEGSGVAILQLSEGSLDFGDSDLTKSFYVKNVGSNGTVLDWSIAASSVDWLSFSPMTGSTNAGSGTQVTAVVDRTKFTGVVSTTVTVNSSANSATLLVSAANVQSSLLVTPEEVDFGGSAVTKNISIKNVGDEGSNMSWSIATPSESWLTVSPMSGTVASNQATVVTLTVDRSAFTGVKTTSIQVTGAGTTKTVSISVDNSVIVTSGLFCYFNFDNPDEVVDWAGNYTGINSGTTASTDTPSGEGHSRQFDGSSFVMIQNSIVPAGGAFTVNFWYKTGRNNQYFLGSDKFYGSRSYSALGLNENTSIRYSSYNSYEAWVTNPVTNYVDNQWHMLTFCFDGNMGMVYLDGVLFETKVKDMKWGSDVNVSFLGTTTVNSGNIGFYNGKMDNFRSYNRMLTVTEIQTLFNAQQ